MDWLKNNWQVAVSALPAIMAVASMVVRLTPAHSDDRWYQIIVDTLGRLGIYRDNGDGSYSHKLPVIHSAKPKDGARRRRTKTPAAAILLAASVTAASCARPIETSKQTYVQVRETYRTAVLSVMVDLRAAGQISDKEWERFIEIHNHILRADAMLRATLIAAEQTLNRDLRYSYIKEAADRLAILTKLVSDAVAYVDSLKCKGDLEKCYQPSTRYSPSGTPSVPRLGKPWSTGYKAHLTQSPPS